MLDSFRSTDFEQLSKFVPLPMWLISDIPVWCFVPGREESGSETEINTAWCWKGTNPKCPRMEEAKWKKTKDIQRVKRWNHRWRCRRPCQCHFSRVGNDWGFPVFQSNKPDFDELAWIGVPIEEQHHLLSTLIQTLEFPRFISNKSRGTFGCQGAL